MSYAPKRSGRKARLVQRAAPPAVNPAPPGQIGGLYRPLSEADLQSIYATALRLLAELGMGEVPKRLWDDLIAAGAVDLGSGRIGLPNALVEDVIARAAKVFTLHGRDPDRSIEVGGDKVYFGTGGAAVNTLDLETERYRPSTLKDLHDFTRLQDTLDNVAWFTRCCIATDVPDPYDLDVNTAYALMKNTSKPVATAFTLAQHVDPIVEMF
ncbi:MAG: trimethylamine methyltransferase family protein, partial [Planktotalea arctica]